MKKQNAYERMKKKSTKGKFNLADLKKDEDVYWVGATIPALLVAGLFDGGITMALAYGARKLYKYNTGK